MSKATITFLPGWGMDKGVYQDIAQQAEAFAKTRLLNLPSADSPEKMAQQLTPRIPRDSILVAWSMAALPALHLASETRLRGLCLLAATPCFCRREGWDCAMATEEVTRMISELDTDRDKCLAGFQALAASNSGRQRLRLLRQHSSAAPTKELRQGLKMLRDCDARQQLAELRCQVEIMLGDRDPLIPSAIAEAVKQIQPRASVTLLPNCGHLPFLSHQEETLSMLRRAAAA